MATLLDTRLLPAESRADAFHSALNAASSPTRVSVNARADGVIQVWSLGSEMSLIDFDVDTPELRMVRTRRHLRQADPERLSVAVNLRGSCVTTNRGRQEAQNAHLRFTDVTSPYGIVWRGRCRAIAFEVDYKHLGLPVDQVRQTLPDVAHSPLHSLLRRHLVDLAQASDALSQPGRDRLGVATAELVRATFDSISPRRQDQRQALVETLPGRIAAYVDQHLAETDLTPTKLASVHHISRRYLYALLSGSDLSPAELIMMKRLEAAKQELEQGQWSISSTAARWGFKDASHFSRRFKAAYGLTPKEWVHR